MHTSDITELYFYWEGRVEVWQGVLVAPSGILRFECHVTGDIRRADSYEITLTEPLFGITRADLELGMHIIRTRVYSEILTRWVVIWISICTVLSIITTLIFLYQIVNMPPPL